MLEVGHENCVVFVMARELSDKCLVCGGTGFAIDSNSGLPTKRKCMACDGTGEALWKITKTERRTQLKGGRINIDATPLHVRISAEAEDYEGYVRLCEERGIVPETKARILGKRRIWRDKGTAGLYWQRHWDAVNSRLLFSSMTYVHYTMKVDRYNALHKKKITAYSKKSAISYAYRNRDEMQHNWGNQNNTYLLESAEDGRPDLVFSRFSKLADFAASTVRGSYRITRIRKFEEKLGTTRDLKSFIKSMPKKTRIQLKHYKKWLEKNEKA